MRMIHTRKTRNPWRLALQRGLAAALAIGLWLGCAPEQTFAQDRGDTEDLAQGNIGLSPSPTIRSERRREAKRTGDWTWVTVVAVGAGYDSNVHQSPDKGPFDEQDSAVFEGGFETAVERYFTRDDRLRLKLKSENAIFSETDDLNEFDQAGSFSYRHRFSPDVNASLFGEVAHDNDHVLNIAGDTLTRDFEAMTYRLKPTVRWEVLDNHQLSLSYQAKWKDYDETSGRNSIDWMKHGPKIEYDVDIWDNVAVEVFYEFTKQEYDEEPANLRNGTELPTNPDEEHEFHEAGFKVDWTVREDLVLTAGYQFDRKDDQFQDYESYDSHTIEGGAEWTATDRLLVEASVAFRDREYDNRPATAPGKDLESERWKIGLTGRYALTEQWACYAAYGLVDRDTNRNTGRSYRDYTQHLISGGVSYTF